MMISSIGGRVAVPHLLPYSVGKFALTALSDGLHAELARDGIGVTTVTPGLMRTGSHRNVVTRGRHEDEARWFGLTSATPLTSMRADRAARQVVRAVLRRRARLTIGAQARALQYVDTIAPELSAAALAFAAAHVLPAPAIDGADTNRAVTSRHLRVGVLSAVFPTRAARQFNQPVAADER